MRTVIRWRLLSLRKDISVIILHSIMAGADLRNLCRYAKSCSKRKFPRALSCYRGRSPFQAEGEPVVHCYTTWGTLRTCRVQSYEPQTQVSLANLLYKAADLERGFSLNKIILYVHGFSIKEDTLEVIRIVKDFIVRSNGVLNIEMTKDLFEHCKVSLTRYQCYLEENRKSREEEESHKQAKILEVNQRLS